MALKEINRPYINKNLAKVLFKIIKFWDIADTLKYLMEDNAFNVNISINELIKLIDYAFDDFEMRLRYIEYIINFAV